MIVVIQCAATKRSDAGYVHTAGGRRILFVAQPSKAPTSTEYVYARPDDLDEHGVPWRVRVCRYNESPGDNSVGLLPAYALYENDVYRALVDKFGIKNTFVLSAGWGLISADFLTPAYDITFSIAADAYKRRRRRDVYRDLCMLPVNADSPIVFFGGKDYVPLFAELSKAVVTSKTVFYNSKEPPTAPGCLRQRFDTATRTNWHYECARAFIAGDISLEGDA